MKSLQVFEYQKLIAGSEYIFTIGTKKVKRQLDLKYIKALWKFYDEKKCPFFKPLRNGICFQHYVGAIKALDLTIEILPKADHTFSENETAYAKWQSILIDMLRVSKHLDTPTISDAYLNIKANSILDLYIHRFVKEINYLIRTGLIKRYRRIQENCTALKGRLIIGRHVQKNFAHQERFYTERSQYDNNHLIHCILRKTITILPNICTSRSLVSSCHQLQMQFPEVENVNVTEVMFDKIAFDRKNEHYKLAIQIAKMLLLNYRPDVSSGSNYSIALLFDMNKLWEEYIHQVLRKAKPNGVKIFSQKPINFWTSGKIKRSIKPDFIISSAKTGNIVIDTKWKNINNDPDNIKLDDLRQMYAYHHYFEARTCVLLYPGNDHPLKDGTYSKIYFSGNEDQNVKHCNILTVKAWRDTETKNTYLNQELGQEILTSLGIG